MKRILLLLAAAAVLAGAVVGWLQRYVVEIEKPASMSSASAAEAGKQVVNQ